MKPKPVTRIDIDNALLRVERGESDQDDANLIRAYLDGIEGRLQVYELGDDEAEE